MYFVSNLAIDFFNYHWNHNSTILHGHIYLPSLFSLIEELQTSFLLFSGSKPRLVLYSQGQYLLIHTEPIILTWFCYPTVINLSSIARLEIYQPASCTLRNAFFICTLFIFERYKHTKIRYKPYSV